MVDVDSADPDDMGADEWEFWCAIHDAVCDDYLAEVLDARYAPLAEDEEEEDEE